MAAYLSGTFLGLTMLYNPNAQTEKSAYDKITLYGDGIFDDVWIRNIEVTDEFINSLTIDNYNTVWDANTVFLADFDNQTLNAGNIQNLSSGITEFIINKRNVNDEVFTTIGTIENTDAPGYSFVDYRVVVGESYEYQILPRTNNEVAEALLSQEIASDYYGWYLIDEENSVVYKFDIELDSNPLSMEYDQTEYQTYKTHNVFSQGNRNFLRGGMNAIIPETIEVNGSFVQSINYMKQIQDFINNGKEKLLKSRKGDVFVVMTKSGVRSRFDDKIQEQPESISVEFTETKRIDNI